MYINNFKLYSFQYINNVFKSISFDERTKIKIYARLNLNKRIRI